MSALGHCALVGGVAFQPIGARVALMVVGGGGTLDPGAETAPGFARNSPMGAVSVASGSGWTTPTATRYVKPMSVMTMIARNS